MNLTALGAACVFLLTTAVVAGARGARPPLPRTWAVASTVSTMIIGVVLWATLTPAGASPWFLGPLAALTGGLMGALLATVRARD